MDRLIEGPKGAGKSYYAVNYLMKFVDYDKFYDAFIPRQNILIVSNLEGLRIPHLDLDDCLKKYGGMVGFFNVENFEKLMEKKGVKNCILIIDEAQSYLPVNYKERSVCYFFEYSRHIGVDVIYLTQGANKVSREILPILENYVTAVPRSKSLPGRFRYIYKDKQGNDLWDEKLKYNQLVFNAYKSFRHEEVEKPKNYFFHMGKKIALALVILGFAVFAFNQVFVSKGKKANASNIPADKNFTPSKSVPVGSGSASLGSGSLQANNQAFLTSPPAVTGQSSSVSIPNHTALENITAVSASSPAVAPITASYHEMWTWVDKKKGLVMSDNPSHIPPNVQYSRVLLHETPSIIPSRPAETPPVGVASTPPVVADGARMGGVQPPAVAGGAALSVK